jgi:hypothetical protein
VHQYPSAKFQFTLDERNAGREMGKCIFERAVIQRDLQPDECLAGVLISASLIRVVAYYSKKACLHLGPSSIGPS